MAQDNDDNSSQNTKVIFKGRVDAGNTYKFTPQTGYARFGNLVSFIKVLAVSATTVPSVALTYWHGPDSATLTTYKNVIAAVGATASTVKAGSTQSESDGHFGDVMQAQLACTGSYWANIAVYEVRKPY
jgi:hypothetical protein